MKLSCDVIADLLPLYRDGVCSAESCGLVEKHISSCEKCRGALSQMGEVFETERKKDDEECLVKSIDGIRKKLKRKIILRGTVIALALCCAFFAVWSVFDILTKLDIVSIGAENFEISDVMCVEEGKVLSFSMKTNNGRAVNVFDTRVEGNVLYIIPKRTVIGKSDDKNKANMESLFVNIMSGDDVSDGILRYFNISAPAAERPFAIEKVYIGSEKDNVLLWEKGMDVPIATEEELKAYRDICEMVAEKYSANIKFYIETEKGTFESEITGLTEKE